MPEVVYPSVDSNGKSRTWNQVFPIWEVNAEDNEWRIINSILESIAMNNRFGGKTVEELKVDLRQRVIEHYQPLWEKNLEELQKLPNAEANAFGVKNDSVTDEHRKVLEDRDKIWSYYGRWMYYIETVFANLGGAYREFKS